MTQRSRESVALGAVVRQAQYGLSVRGQRIGRTPILRMNCQERGRIVFRDLQYVDLDERTMKAHLLERGDILFNRTNSFELVGRTAHYDSDIPAVFASYLIRLKLDLQRVDPAYFAYYLNWPPTQRRLKALATRGVSQSNISASKLKELQVSLPLIEDQRTVASILNKIQAAIDVQTRIVATLKELRAATIRLLFSGWEAWQQARLGQLCTPAGIQTGPFGSLLHKSDYVSEGIPLLNPTHYRTGRIAKENLPRVSEEVAASLTRFRLEPEDLVFSRRGDVTSHALVSEFEAGWLCGTGSLIVRADPDRVNREYLFWALAAEPCTTYLIQHAVGTIMPNINTKILADVPVPLPRAPDQERIARSLNAVDSSLSAAERRLLLIANLFDVALESLMSGDIRLGEDRFSARRLGGSFVVAV